jgi:hypothetical protein
MLRSLLEAALPFCLPFAAYALFMVLQQRYPFVASAWTRGPVAVLTVCGLGLAVAAFLLAGLFEPRHHGGYVPAHIENGVLQPGRME